MGGVLSRVGMRILTAVLTEKVLIAILIALGDYLVNKSSNRLDDQVWAKVREALRPEG